MTAAALKAGLAAVQHLPKLAQSGRVPVDRRVTAYERFAAAVWAVVESDGSVRAIQPIAGRKFGGGLGYHSMFVRITERALMAHGDLLGAYGALRVLAPNVVVSAASEVADRLGNLATTPVGAREQHAENQSAVGFAMVIFDQICRIDLGVEEHPCMPRAGWKPTSWWRRGKWWWQRSRRGDWPDLPPPVIESETARAALVTR
nr:hypothetical protein Ade03nite_62310 [Actinoplanes derwentensis]